MIENRRETEIKKRTNQMGANQVPNTVQVTRRRIHWSKKKSVAIALFLGLWDGSN
jgi:hypothetical protein